MTLALATAPSAADEPDEENATRLRATVIFASLDAAGGKVLIANGFKMAAGAGGLDASGFRLLASAGTSQEPARLAPRQGLIRKSQASALFGHEWVLGQTYAALHAGPEAELGVTDFGDGRALEIERRHGIKLQGDIWTRPWSDGLIQAGLSLSSLDRRIWARIGLGHRLWDDVHVGPEIEAYRDRNDDGGRYHKLRLGLHVTGLTLWRVSFRLSAGWQRASDRPGEAYGTLTAHWRY